MHRLLVCFSAVKESYFVLFIAVLFQGALLSKPKVPFFLKNQYCVTQECEDLAQDIRTSLNTSVQPCTNFYEFACGGWVSRTTKPDSEPVWNHWQELSYKLNTRIEDIVTSYNSDSGETFSKVKTYFKSCMQMKQMKELYLEQLRNLIGEFGGWPIHSSSWKYGNFRPFDMIAKITRMLGIHPIVNINVNLDYKNNKRHIIYIEPGNLIFPSYILLDSRRYKLEINAYRTWIYETVKHLYTDKIKTAIKLDINRIISLEISLAKMMAKARNERINVENLSKKTQIDWQKFFDILYDGSEISVKQSDNVVIKNYSYLKNTIALLRKLDSKTVANYLIWHIVKDLSRDTSQYMGNLNFAVDQVIMGTKSDLRRKDECLQRIKMYFSYALVPQYKEKYIHPNTGNEVKEIINNMKIEFLKMLRKNDWLAEETKLLAIEKVKNIKYLVGYPNWADNESYIENYYSDLNITENHFYNTIRLKKYFSERNLFELNQAGDKIVWPSNVFEVNGYYSVLQNAIFIPLGLLESPFFQSTRSSLFNYGAIGSLIGHEVTHSLDSTGRHADREGNIMRWWRKSDIKEYEERSDCYQQYYNKITMNELLTMEENIADNIGLKISYLAFESAKLKHSIPASLQLAEFTKEQLFFISYAQMWCELSTDTDLFSLDEHAPVQDRVLGTLYNSEYFESAFSCKRKNNQTKCEIW